MFLFFWSQVNLYYVHVTYTYIIYKHFNYLSCVCGCVNVQDQHYLDFLRQIFLSQELNLLMWLVSLITLTSPISAFQDWIRVMRSSQPIQRLLTGSYLLSSLCSTSALTAEPSPQLRFLNVNYFRYYVFLFKNNTITNRNFN